MKTQLRKTLVSTVLTVFMALGIQAQIFFDFSGGLPSGSELFGNARIAGGVLHLTDAELGTNGHFLISNVGDGKPVKAATIQWRSLIGGGVNGGADGYSVNWATDLPETPSYANPGEDGAGSGLTVTVDTFDNGGEVVGIEIRWQSNIVASTSIPKDDPGGGATFLRKNAFVDAELTVDARGEAKFSYDDITLTAVLDGWKAIKGGDILFGARTGGASDNHWIDDLRVATGIFTAGAFNGLFSDVDVLHERSGFVNLKVTAKGKFSGYMMLGGTRYPLRGAFHPTNLNAEISISRPGFTTLTVELALTDKDTILGRVTDGIWSSPLLANRQVWNKKLNPALPYATNYTAVINVSGIATEPRGYGYGSYKVDLGGRLKFVGKLGDGTPITQSVPISRDGRWALFFLSYRGKGSVQGWVTVDNDSEGGAVLRWFKGAAAGGPLYPSGFDFDPLVFTSPYAPPPPGTRIVSFSDGQVDFSFGNLTSSFENKVLLTEDQVVFNRGTNRLTMKFKVTTGTFTGTVNVPGTNTVIKYSGVISQGYSAGAGHFIGKTESGSVLLTVDPNP